MGYLNSKFSKTIILLGILSILYVIWISFGLRGYFYMAWNLFLAWFPLGIMILILLLNTKYGGAMIVKIATILLWFLWLLFYPNSPYIITDFIHISNNHYSIINPQNTSYYIFNDELKIWVDLVVIGIGVWIGYLVGFISLYINQLLVIRKYNKFTSWLFVLFIHLLTGFAIYIGRFIRWNSWDVIRQPIAILRSCINENAHNFTLLFGFFSFVLYAVNFVFLEIGHYSEKTQ